MYTTGIVYIIKSYDTVGQLRFFIICPVYPHINCHIICAILNISYGSSGSVVLVYITGIVRVVVYLCYLSSAAVCVLVLKLFRTVFLSIPYFGYPVKVVVFIPYRDPVSVIQLFQFAVVGIVFICREGFVSGFDRSGIAVIVICEAVCGGSA